MLLMETIAKIRRLFYKDKLSRREIAKRLRLNRRTVSKHLNTSEPPKYQRRKQEYPKLGPYLEFINAHLLADVAKPARERLSIRRFFEVLKSHGYEGQYSALSAYARRFNAQQRLKETKVFIPQSFGVAEAYQFDWSIETVKLAGELVKVSVAHLRLCNSRAFFIKAYPNQQMEMLMDAHNEAFEFLGGACSRGIYDNMKTAVIAIQAGKERTWNEQFLGLMNHYLIEPVACTPASGWEKGQVERQVKTLRKRLFEPTLSFTNLQELNTYLREQCSLLMHEFKHPEDKKVTVAQALEVEKGSLTRCSAYSWYRAKLVYVSNLSLVVYQGHKYSVPCEFAGKEVTLQVFAQHIKVVYQGQCIATHERSFVKNASSYNAWHYLSALKRKPGALRNGEPFLNWQLPAPLLELQKYLLAKPKGDKAMVELLSLVAEHGEETGLIAASLALEEGVPTVEAVRNIINRLNEPMIPQMKGKEIPLNTPPQANCMRYDNLLKGDLHATR